MATFTGEAIAERQGIYAIEESTEYTREDVTGASYLSPVGALDFSKPVLNLAQNLERSLTLGRKTGIQLKAGEGTIGITTYLKPSGTAGSVPHAAALWKGLFGTQTINGGTSVVYSFADIDTGIPSQTVQVRVDHMDFWFSTKVNQLTITLNPGGTDDGLIQLQWQLMIAKTYGWAGTAYGTTTGGNSTITLQNDRESLRYRAGCLVQIDDDDNSGSGWVVTAVDDSANTLTVTGTPSAKTNQLVIPFRPTPAEPTGNLIAAFEDYMSIKPSGAGSYHDIPVTNVTTVINNNLSFTNDEKDDNAYGGRVRRVTERAVGITTIAYFYREMSEYVGVGDKYLQQGITIPCGDTAGDILTLVAPNCRTINPALNNDDLIKQTIEWTAHETSTGDDEITATFT